MRNTGLEEAQAGIKTAGRNINNLRYADDTTLMAESNEELKSLLMKVIKESEKLGLNLTIQKTKIMASSPITSRQIDGETWKQWLTILGGSKITADGDCSHEIKRRLLLQDGLVRSPCSPRDSQESSPALHFKSIYSLALSFLYNPTLTSIHDYWKNYSLD